MLPWRGHVEHRPQLLDLASHFGHEGSFYVHMNEGRLLNSLIASHLHISIINSLMTQTAMLNFDQHRLERHTFISRNLKFHVLRHISSHPALGTQKTKTQNAWQPGVDQSTTASVTKTLGSWKDGREQLLRWCFFNPSRYPGFNPYI